jgi:D-alanyl-D-alanine dipeptidase
MTGAGFLQLAHEWWHYDAFPGDHVRRTFRIIE